MPASFLVLARRHSQRSHVIATLGAVLDASPRGIARCAVASSSLAGRAGPRAVIDVAPPLPPRLRQSDVARGQAHGGRGGTRVGRRARREEVRDEEEGQCAGERADQHEHADVFEGGRLDAAERRKQAHPEEAADIAAEPDEPHVDCEGGAGALAGRLARDEREEGDAEHVVDQRLHQLGAEGEERIGQPSGEVEPAHPEEVEQVDDDEEGLERVVDGAVAQPREDLRVDDEPEQKGDLGAEVEHPDEPAGGAALERMPPHPGPASLLCVRRWSSREGGGSVTGPHSLEKQGSGCSPGIGSAGEQLSSVSL
mmetsp:Transcript_12890/g.38555  ORF Transcript_12890/g.38555 Transcript_12890/m.38555 type:complete len:311 (+) Transcript_12890:52-984(+)